MTESKVICASVRDKQLALCKAAYLNAPLHLNNNLFQQHGKYNPAPLISDYFLVGSQSGWDLRA